MVPTGRAALLVALGVPVVALDFGYTETPVEAFDPDRVISHYDELWDAVAPYLRLQEEKA